MGSMCFWNPSLTVEEARGILGGTEHRPPAQEGRVRLPVFGRTLLPPEKT